MQRRWGCLTQRRKDAEERRKRRKGKTQRDRDEKLDKGDSKYPKKVQARKDAEETLEIPCEKTQRHKVRLKAFQTQ
jgi:hypothetical protein